MKKKLVASLIASSLICTAQAQQVGPTIFQCAKIAVCDGATKTCAFNTPDMQYLATQTIISGVLDGWFFLQTVETIPYPQGAQYRYASCMYMNTITGAEVKYDSQSFHGSYFDPGSSSDGWSGNWCNGADHACPMKHHS